MRHTCFPDGRFSFLQNYYIALSPHPVVTLKAMTVQEARLVKVRLVPFPFTVP